MNDPQTTPRHTLPEEVPLPPRLQAEYVRLIYPQGSQALHVVSVGQRVQGYLTHWWEGRPCPCHGNRDDCTPCKAGQEPRWNGYLNVIALPSLRRRVLCISEGAFRHSKSLQEHDGTLRGKGLKLERMGHAKNAPVRVLVGTPGTKVTLPADWDLLGCLCRIWGILPTFFHSRIAEPGMTQADYTTSDERPFKKGRRNHAN